MELSARQPLPVVVPSLVGTSGLHSDHISRDAHNIVKFAGDAPRWRTTLSGVLLALGSELDGLVSQCALRSRKDQIALQASQGRASTTIVYIEEKHWAERLPLE